MLHGCGSVTQMLVCEGTGHGHVSVHEGIADWSGFPPCPGLLSMNAHSGTTTPGLESWPGVDGTRGLNLEPHHTVHGSRVYPCWCSSVAVSLCHQDTPPPRMSGGDHTALLGWNLPRLGCCSDNK